MGWGSGQGDAEWVGGWGWGSGVASVAGLRESSLGPDFLTVPLLPRAGSSSCDEEISGSYTGVSKGYLFYPHPHKPFRVVISMTDAPSVSNVCLRGCPARLGLKGSRKLFPWKTGTSVISYKAKLYF